METILLVVHLILAISLVITVLLQRSEGGGLGIGGGGGGGGTAGGLMSVRGTANFLTRATAVLAGMFMLTSLSLAIIAGNRTTPQSILDTPAATSTEQPGPKEGEVPLSR